MVCVHRVFTRCVYMVSLHVVFELCVSTWCVCTMCLHCVCILCVTWCEQGVFTLCVTCRVYMLCVPTCRYMSRLQDVVTWCVYMVRLHCVLHCVNPLYVRWCVYMVCLHCAFTWWRSSVVLHGCDAWWCLQVWCVQT